MEIERLNHKVTRESMALVEGLCGIFQALSSTLGTRKQLQTKHNYAAVAEGLALASMPTGT